MYVSANSLCILCVVTIVSSPVSWSSSHRNRLASASAAAEAATKEPAEVGPTGQGQTTYRNGTFPVRPDNRKDSRHAPFQLLNPKPADVSIECKALRSKRYITDGFCTSLKPVEDMVCTGNCLPISDLPWYAEFIKVWSRTKTLQYRCVDDDVRYRRVTFSCHSGETRSYKIRVVRSCKCKKFIRNQNESPADYQPEQSERQGRRRLQKLSNISSDQK